MLMNYTLLKCKEVYRFTKPQEKINPHMSNIQIFAENESKLENTIQTIKIFCLDIKMGFEIF